MTKYRSFMAGAVALAIVALGSVGPAHAQLGNGSSIIGSGDESIGVAQDTASSKAAKASVPRAIGTCVINRVAYRTQSNNVNTTSTTFVTMANTHLPVTHAAGCLIVDFAGLVLTSDSTNQIVIRAWIGGIGAAEPPIVAFGRPVDTDASETHSMRFVFPSVPAGTHTVRIDWHSGDGGTVHVLYRTLTVQYRQ